jgi:bifunctional non-homologous end joining protein LigD
MKRAKPVSGGKLSSYRRKRDFSRTAEPEGSRTMKRSGLLRYVIQKHAASRLHYDFRLEFEGVLKSWAVTRGPSLDPSQKRLAVEVENHPVEYGDFEGTIPKGQYGGGTVQLWDRGYWIPEQDSVREAFRDGNIKFSLKGERLHGSWVLVRMKSGRLRSSRNNWLLIKHRDEFARSGEADSLLANDRSVASGRTMGEIARGKGPRPTAFMMRRERRFAADAVWDSSDAQGRESGG